jgi:flagellar motility protein MotE (MotC chaperone)
MRQKDSRLVVLEREKYQLLAMINDEQKKDIIKMQETIAVLETALKEMTRRTDSQSRFFNTFHLAGRPPISR